MKPPTGLTSEEAKRLLDQFGRNEIIEQSKTTPITIFFSQFRTFIVWLLILAAIISFALGEMLDGVMIVTIVILNALFGFFQEYKAEQAIKALKTMVVSQIRVLRDGKEDQLDSSLLVPGDIILLAEGDRVPADAVLLESKNVEVNESMLTGESLPVEKNARNSPDSAPEQMILMGTVLTRGRGVAQVLTTGMNTRFGTIAKSLSSITSEETPLEKKTASLAKSLGIAGISASAFLFVAGIITHHPLFEMLFTSISIAVAAVPEGLPAVITITLALGTQRMAKQRAVIRKLAAIESLGSLTVIATDKTGTLTKNEMQITSCWLNGTEHDEVKSIPQSHALQMLLSIGILCNTAGLRRREAHAAPGILGDPTEGALLLFAEKFGLSYEQERKDAEILDEYEFDSRIKLMSVVVRKPHTPGLHLFTKGAPEILLHKSTSIVTSEGVKKITHEHVREITESITRFAQKGLRVIALGYRDADTFSSQREKEERDYTFVGFVGMADPPRPEIRSAMAKARAAGVRTIMITGDSPLTAEAIGRQVGLIAEGQEGVITGDEFAALSEAEALAVVRETNIYARIAPEDKLKIVSLLQKQGEIVVVTGDGVNDALALKQANVGVAMGITGSDVAKGAADMVVTDDNYATIVSAIEEGRTIYENMKASIKYLIGCNIGEVASIIIATLLGWPIILTPIQILFINLVTDGLPALGLAVVPSDASIMRRKPNRSGSLFTRFDLRWLIETSIISTIVILAAFAIGQWVTGSIVISRTLAFTASIIVQQYIYLDLQARNRSVLSSFHKRGLLPAIGIIPIFFQLIILYVPFFQQLFGVAALPPFLLMFVTIVPGVAIVISEIRKHIAPWVYYPS